MNNLKTSAVVVFHSDMASLLKAIQSLRGQADEIIVIDVSPTSETRSLSESPEPLPQSDVTYLLKPGNLGYGWACNIGVTASTNDVVLISNPDVIYDDGALARLAEVATLGHLCGPVQSKGRSSDTWIDEADSLQLGISKSASLNRWLGIGRKKFENSCRSMLLDRNSDVMVTPSNITLSGAALMATKETWNRLGGFDERFFLYQEDADLCVRAHTMGIPVSLVKTARMTHWSGSTRGGFDVSVLRWAIHSEQLAWQAHCLPSKWLTLIQLVGVSGRVILSCARGRLGDATGWARTLGNVLAS